MLNFPQLVKIHSYNRNWIFSLMSDLKMIHMWGIFMKNGALKLCVEALGLLKSTLALLNQNIQMIMTSFFSVQIQDSLSQGFNWVNQIFSGFTAKFTITDRWIYVRSFMHLSSAFTERLSIQHCSIINQNWKNEQWWWWTLPRVYRHSRPQFMWPVNPLATVWLKRQQLR